MIAEQLSFSRLVFHKGEIYRLRPVVDFDVPAIRRLVNAAYADSYGTALIWKSRFEVHIDQVIGLAYQVESLQTSA